MEGSPEAATTPSSQILVLTKDSMFLKTPLLLGLIVLGTHVWPIQKEFVDVSKDHDYLVASVEFALARFNEDNTGRILIHVVGGRAGPEKGEFQTYCPCPDYGPCMTSPDLGAMPAGP